MDFVRLCAFGTRYTYRPPAHTEAFGVQIPSPEWAPSSYKLTLNSNSLQVLVQLVSLQKPVLFLLYRSDLHQPCSIRLVSPCSVNDFTNRITLVMTAMTQFCELFGLDSR